MSFVALEACWFDDVVFLTPLSSCGTSVRPLLTRRCGGSGWQAAGTAAVRAVIRVPGNEGVGAIRVIRVSAQ